MGSLVNQIILEQIFQSSRMQRCALPWYSNSGDELISGLSQVQRDP